MEHWSIFEVPRGEFAGCSEKGRDVRPNCKSSTTRRSESLREKSAILLAAIDRWYPTARLAMGLANTECSVNAVCPSGHPLAKARAVHRMPDYTGLSPLTSFARAIRVTSLDRELRADVLLISQLSLQNEICLVVPSHLAKRTAESAQDLAYEKSSTSLLIQPYWKTTSETSVAASYTSRNVSVRMPIESIYL